MKKIAILAVILMCTLPLAAAGGRPGAPQPILDVSAVTVTNDGLLITVRAEGHTSTAGWTNVQLMFAGNSKDAVLYTFQGVPPSGMAAQVVTPVSATQTLRAYLAGHRPFVLVSAKTNNKKAPIPYPPGKP